VVVRGGAWAWGLAAAFTLALAPQVSRADGAFPNGQSILVPADRPDEIVLATNFGLVTSEDAGRTWLYSCELAVTSYGRLYQVGPAPADRLFAIAGGKLVFSDDGACGWQTAGGALGDDLCEDAFVDPTDGTHVLAAGLANGEGIAYSVYQSTDSGATFSRALYVAAPGDFITGLEIAKSDPMTIDLTLADSAGTAPTLARSTDGGTTWQLTDLTAALGSGQVRILAIDPTDADRVFLRVIEAVGDTLAIATDGGATVTTPLVLDGGLGAFVRTGAGTLLAFGTAAGAPALFRSTDSGATFVPVAGPPNILALAERAGTVYAATDSSLGPFAEATSTDEGTTWTPGLAFAQVSAIAPCLESACQADCEMRAQQQQWPAAICTAQAPVIDSPDAATVVDAGGTHDAVAVGPPFDGGTMRIDAGDTPHPAGGCSCATAPRSDSDAWPALLLLAALLRRRRLSA
jgi:MYXO-CTERM domain-containing protein